LKSDNHLTDTIIIRSLLTEKSLDLVIIFHVRIIGFGS